MDRHTIRQRSRIFGLVREFFASNGYIEVDTPLLSPAVIPEVTIELFSTQFVHPYREREELFLLPSPEYWHKILLSQGIEENFFQLSKAFRNSEQLSPIHNIEFTLLEWYTQNREYRFSMGFTKSLLQHLAMELMGEVLEFNKLSVQEACMRYAGLDLDELGSVREIQRVAEKRGHRIEENESWNDTFNRIFVSDVEPKLETDLPLFLLDYPAQIPCLAKAGPKRGYRQRWELYWKGMEIANCYTEEIDPQSVRRYMEQEGAEKEEKAMIPAAWDRDYWEHFSGEYPPSTGVALGLDRLIMILLNKKNIDDVIFFPFRGKTSAHKIVKDGKKS